AVEHVQRLRDWEIHVVRDRPSLHLYRKALRLQTLSATGGARTQRPIALELILRGPASFIEPPAQVRNQSFESQGAWGFAPAWSRAAAVLTAFARGRRFVVATPTRLARWGRRLLARAGGSLPRPKQQDLAQPARKPS